MKASHGGWQEKASSQGVRIFMFFHWDHGFPLGLCLCLSFRFMLFLWFFGFGYMSFLRSFWFGYKVISDGWGNEWFAQRAMEQLWRENPFLTTTATQHGSGLSHGGCTGIQRWWQQTGRPWVYWDTGVGEMDRPMGSIYSGDLGLDKLSSHRVPHHLISLCNEIHTLSFPLFDITCSFRDMVDPHGQVVSYPLTRFLRSLCQNSSV